MITYESPKNVCSNNLIVKLSGKRVGEIKEVINKWQYFPKGGKEGGARWSSLAHCKRSIEEIYAASH